MMFVIVMDILNRLFRKADEWSLYHSLGVKEIPFRTSLYADDLEIFVSMLGQDLRLTCDILDIFQAASRLACNINKSQLIPIRCTDEQVSQACIDFPCQLMSFPIKYLGIPLLVTKLPKSALQPLMDKVADKLPAWRGRLVHRSGCLTLIKTTLSAIPVYTSISVALSPWLQKGLRKIMTAFLWTGINVVQNGKCLVAWNRIQRPLELGGLRVPDLKRMGIAL
jgi:hypothetical protein